MKKKNPSNIHIAVSFSISATFVNCVTTNSQALGFDLLLTAIVEAFRRGLGFEMGGYIFGLSPLRFALS